MNRIKEVVYGLGGFDESKPDNNLVEIIYYSDQEEAEIIAQEEAALAKATLLQKLGLSEDEVKLLLS